MAVFFYAVVLHGLVFAVLYKLALTDSCRHDMAARWHEKYLEHMSVRNRTGQDRTGQDRTGQDRTRQDPGQDRTGQDKFNKSYGILS